MLEGKIIKNISKYYTIIANNNYYVCEPKGKFRQEKISPFVGDDVLFDSSTLIIKEIKPRKNFLNRPRIANIDYALIVTSIKSPDISLNLLDKQITNILINNVRPLICFTKIDLATPKEKKYLDKLVTYYNHLGIKTFNNQNLEELISYLQDKIVVLTGQSGSGKSSLINKIEPSLQLKTSEISKSLNRGIHTTRHTEIYNILGMWLCDTPGFSSLDLSNYTEENIRMSFQEFANYSCEFRDCKHLKEKNCGVKKAVLDGEILPSRYENYQQFLREVKRWK